MYTIKKREENEYIYIGINVDDFLVTASSGKVNNII